MMTLTKYLESKNDEIAASISRSDFITRKGERIYICSTYNYFLTYAEPLINSNIAEVEANKRADAEHEAWLLKYQEEEKQVGIVAWYKKLVKLLRGKE